MERVVRRCGFARTADVGGDASLGRRRRPAGRCRAHIVLPIPWCIFPDVDQTVVAAERTVPNDVSGRTVEFGNDLAATAPTAGAAPAGHIRQPIALRQVVGHPGHDRAKEDRETQHSFRNGLRQTKLSRFRINSRPPINRDRSNSVTNAVARRGVCAARSVARRDP